jgi:prephenate dehydratase
LGELATRGINLTKLESRPRRNRPWSYVFFADFEGSMEEERCREAIGGLIRIAGFVKILGSYRRAEGPVGPRQCRRLL